MRKNIYTDLALEVKELYNEEKEELSGVSVEEFVENNVKVTEVKVLDENGEKSMGKPIGTYLTMEIPDFVHYDGETMDDTSKVVAKWLKPIVDMRKNKTALVVGLGNWNVTPDAIGPKVISKTMITRHLKELVPDKIDEEITPVCGITPGVLGLTGIETAEIIKGIVEKIKPDIIVAVDALAARKMHRVNKTIQISTTGISPGAGVGNARKELNEKTIGVPVIAIGVPTVVHAATLANDTIDLAIDEMSKYATEGSDFYNMLKNMDRNEKHRMINEILNPYVGNLMVTPKEVDVVTESMSKIIANAINISLQPALQLEDINKFLN